MNKSRTKPTPTILPSTGRIVLIRDGRVLTRRSRRVARLAARGPAACG